MNLLFIVGRLGQDPIKKEVNGQALTKFSVATSKKWKDTAGTSHEETTWHEVTVWGKLADVCAQYLRKGRQVAVVGEVRIQKGTGNHEGKTFYSVTAKEVEFLGDAPQQQSQPSNSAQMSEPSFTESDVPF